MNFRVFLICFSLLFLASFVQADEVYLDNGDRISGQILKKDVDKIVIDTATMGTVVIKKEFVQSISSPDKVDSKPIVAKEDEEKAASWKGKWSLAGFQQGGNTRKRRLNYGLKLNKKLSASEWTIESKSSYASESREMTEQKHYGMMRYGYQLREGSKWFFFGKFEADADRFSNINYRLVPSYGGGYWFSDTDDLKMVTDGAIGYQYTVYRDNTKNEGEWVWIPRFYIDTKFIWNMRLTQEITLYPSLEDVEVYRLRSETSLVQPISERVSWKLTLADDYNSNPKGSTKKNDYSLTAGIDVAF